MSHSNPSDQELKELLTNATTIAIVGASSNPDKASYGIMQKLPKRRLQRHSRQPDARPKSSASDRIRRSSTSRSAIDIVDVFRRAEDTPAIADDAVTIGAKALWLQTGIASEDAAARAKAGGLTVVMDTCIGATHSLLRVRRQSLHAWSASRLRC